MRLFHRSLSGPLHTHTQTIFRFRWLYVVLAVSICLLSSIPALVFYDAAMEELHKTNHADETTRTIQFIAYVDSLTNLAQNWVLLKELEEYCRIYDPTKPRGYGYHETVEGGMHVHIFYQHENAEARHEIQAVLVQQGCSATFEHEKALIIEHVAENVKSVERALLMSNNVQYDAVVTIRLGDVISLPSLSSFHNALLHVTNTPGAMVCANEQATWPLLFLQMIGYDACCIRRAHCSDAFTMYSWKSWSSSQCNFDAKENDATNPEGQLRRQSSNNSNKAPHAIFQECLLERRDVTWIGVQPDLVVWRKKWWTPWLFLLIFLVMARLLWDRVTSNFATLWRTGTCAIRGGYPETSTKLR